MTRAGGVGAASARAWLPVAEGDVGRRLCCCGFILAGSGGFWVEVGGAGSDPQTHTRARTHTHAYTQWNIIEI